MRLSPDTYFPEELVEGYTSLIWTERHTDDGGFELKSPYIAETMDRLPDGCLAAIRESDEVMYVENSVIDTNDDGIDEVTVTGRSFEAPSMEKRILTGEYGEPWSMRKDYTVQEAVMVLIWNSLVNPTGIDVTRPPSYDHNTGENLPMVYVTNSIIPQGFTGLITDLETVQQWWLDAGEVYQQVKDLLTLGEIGVRLIKPTSQGDFTWIDDVETDGDIVYLDTGTGGSATIDDRQHLRFDVYNGRNRTIFPSALDPLPATIFRYDAGDIENPSYLFTRKGMKNWAHGASPVGSVEVWDGDELGDPAPTSHALAQLWLDGGTPGAGVDDADFLLALKQKLRVELKKNNRQILMDGAVSGAAPYSYGRYEEGGDYFLGDRVTVVGRYGLVETMQVSEYVRAENAEGEVAYPTLIHIP